MEARPTLVVRTEVVLKEIFAIDTRLKQLGIEAESLLKETKHMNKEYGEDMRNEFKHFENIVRKAKAGVLVSEVKVRSPSQKRCRYWNRGYCREGISNCPFYHPPDDCGQHLQEGCCSSQRCALRHRKRCKYFETQAGCFRKGQCQYLHVDDPARETVNTEIEEEITVIKAVSECVLEKENKDSNMEAEEDIG